jgi:hypothetical protein
LGTNAAKDCTVKISPAKAKELKVKSGDMVGLIGRRRRAAYVTVSVKKGQKGTACEVSLNLAKNLRIRDGDKIKLAPLGGDAEDHERSGDMKLLQVSAPTTVAAATFSPIADSLISLQAGEGGDDISDEELTERFLTPYLNLDQEEKSILVKQGHVLTLQDENGKHLEFMISNVELEGDDESAEEEVEGTHTNIYIV